MNGVAGGQRHPARLDRAVRPERGIDGVGNQTGFRRKLLRVAKHAGLREQLGKGMARWRRPAADQGKNLSADAAHLAEIYFAAGIHAERRKPGVIGTGIRPGTLGHDAQDILFDGRGRFIHRPDRAA